MFRIVIVGWKAERYIERCLNSVIHQSVQDWTACVVLDPAGDRTVDIAQAISAKDSRIKVIANEKQLYAIPNIIRSINEQHPADDDVIATIDSDDWASGPDTLAIVKKCYDANPDLLVTHGSWMPYPDPNGPTNNGPYSPADWAKGIRRVDWRATHLRTFKYKVWKHVKDEDLRGSDGEYFRTAWDLAMLFPMLEMANMHRVQYIPERIYTYNVETPYNDSKMRLQEQMSTADYIAAKPSYSYIENF